MALRRVCGGDGGGGDGVGGMLTASIRGRAAAFYFKSTCKLFFSSGDDKLTSGELFFYTQLWTYGSNGKLK